MQQVYAGLPSTAGIPIERVGTTDCWHFHVSRGAIDADVWVDTKTRFLRKVSGRFEGSDLNETYDLLPLDVNAEAKRLFDTKNLRMLLSQ